MLTFRVHFMELGFSTYEWTIDKPFFQEIQGEVLYVTADGAELNAVNAAFSGIPKIENGKDHKKLKAQITWKGPWAQFIVDNMPR